MKSGKKALRLVLSLALLCVLVITGTYIYFVRFADRSGWLQQGNQYYYLDSRGNPITGWHEEDGSRYYFNASGVMLTGWQQFEDGVRYFSPAGVMRIGWVELDTGTWFLQEDGTTFTGWREIDGERRYFLEDGRLATGWQTIGGQRYYLTNGGTLQTGWLNLEEGNYYLDGNGVLSTGLTQIEDKTYYFFEGSGLQLEGWLDLDDARYYFGPDGMATGWQEIDGRRSFFDEDGKMHTGWLQQGEYRYYLLEDGTAATDPMEIDGEMCFFTPNGEYVLLVNYQYGMPENYKIDLVRYGQWARVAAIAESHLRQMMQDCKDSGVECWLNCGFRTFDEQTTILENRTEEYTKQGMNYDAARAKALETVAVPGYSEHQTGLAMDIVCSVDPVWLQEHCWEYGFILRYPEGKSQITNIVYEHWHYRYVGVEISMAMRDTGLCLEEYLGAA